MTNRAQIHEFYLSHHNFEIWRFIRDIKIGKKSKMSAQYLQKYESYEHRV